MKASLRALLEFTVDYAGTFPPARLELAAALREYAEHRAGPHAWMLGPFVLAAAKIPEFDELAGTGAPPPGEAWPVTVVLSADVEADLERAGSFAGRAAGRARVVAVEAPPLPPSRIGPAAARAPTGAAAFFEVPLDPDPGPLLAAIGEAGAAAKVRTGGLKPEAIPAADRLAAFLLAAARARLPFKATAGLHRPLRSARPLDGGGPPVAMHGFLNLAVAAALAWAGKIGPGETRAVLEETSAAAFGLAEDGVAWRDIRLDLRAITDSRRRFFRSFGSCSFREPVEGIEECGR